MELENQILQFSCVACQVVTVEKLQERSFVDQQSPDWMDTHVKKLVINL